MTEDTNLTRPVGALVHALRILRHLAAQGTAEGVTTIARATGVNGSTCYNILRTLVAEGVVIFDPATKTYRLGLGLVELAVGVLGANPGDLPIEQVTRVSLMVNLKTAQMLGVTVPQSILLRADRVIE